MKQGDPARGVHTRNVAGKLVGRDTWKPSPPPLSPQEAQQEAGAVFQEGQGCCSRTRGSGGGNGWEDGKGGIPEAASPTVGKLDLDGKHCGCNSLASPLLPRAAADCGGIPGPSPERPQRSCGMRRAGAGWRGGRMAGMPVFPGRLDNKTLQYWRGQGGGWYFSTSGVQDLGSDDLASQTSLATFWLCDRKPPLSLSEAPSCHLLVCLEQID